MSWPCAALRDVDLSPRCTMRVGGRAAWLLEPGDPDELREAWCAARERGLEPRILGGGANLLIDDGELEERLAEACAGIFGCSCVEFPFASQSSCVAAEKTKLAEMEIAEPESLDDAVAVRVEELQRRPVV